MLKLQVDSSDGTMTTALQKACQEDHSEVVSFLLKRGARTDLLVGFYYWVYWETSTVYFVVLSIAFREDSLIGHVLYIHYVCIS